MQNQELNLNPEQATNPNQKLFDAIFLTRRTIKLAAESHSNYKQLKINLNQNSKSNE